MELHPKSKSVMATVLFLIILCWPADNSKAKTSLRQSLVLSDYHRIRAADSICHTFNADMYGYSTDYENNIKLHLQNAYTYAKQAAQYAQQDYNNGVATTFYNAYYEYTTVSAIQNFLAIVVYYADIDPADHATEYENTKEALDNFYKATALYDMAAIYAGCFPVE